MIIIIIIKHYMKSVRSDSLLPFKVYITVHNTSKKSKIYNQNYIMQQHWFIDSNIYAVGQ